MTSNDSLISLLFLACCFCLPVEMTGKVARTGQSGFICVGASLDIQREKKKIPISALLFALLLLVFMVAHIWLGGHGGHTSVGAQYATFHYNGSRDDGWISKLFQRQRNRPLSKQRLVNDDYQLQQHSTSLDLPTKQIKEADGLGSPTETKWLN